MRSADVHHDTTMLVPGAHRVIRLLDVDEGPYAGALVTDRESVAVLTDADTLSGWAGWGHAGDEHVAGPLDVVRRSDGHDVLLPWCTERVAVFLGRREAVAELLSAGEVSTLVGSLLRGLDELGRSPSGTETGEWWLSDRGRPLFVIGHGDDARVAAATLIDRVHRTTLDRISARLLASIREGLQKDAQRPGAPTRQLQLWEGELFSIAAPRPLRRDTHAPERARDNEMARSLRAAPIETRRDARAAARGIEAGERSGVVHAVRLATIATITSVRETTRWIARCRSRFVTSGRRMATDHAMSESAQGRREGVERASARPLRRFIVAGAAGAMILAGGLLWPGGATGEAPAVDGAAMRDDGRDVEIAAEPGREEATRSPSAPAPQATTADDGAEDSGPDVPDLDDPVSAAPALLSAVYACAEQGDQACVEAVAPGSTAVNDILATEKKGSRAQQVQVSLVDEYGDVAVVRVSPASSGATASSSSGERMLVLVRPEEKWLVRDAYDVADQPG
ncbi:hypothetical protein [Microbacterium sp. UFMG61]|uniref:hypothetical protein n=1 Tax=Microbacterium sp. UFMG61 TaxID=2745935 RepID=UPI00188F7D05|nr:hypothetical protein [Microbacterium sp. UFMG61]